MKIKVRRVHPVQVRTLLRGWLASWRRIAFAASAITPAAKGPNDPLTLRLLALRAVANRDAASLDKVLRQPGADPNGFGAGLLVRAVEAGHAAVVQVLMAQPGIDPNRSHLDGTTALIAAAGADRADLVAALMAHPRTDPDLTRSDGMTALSLAQELGHGTCVEALKRRSPRAGRRLHLVQAEALRRT